MVKAKAKKGKDAGRRPQFLSLPKGRGRLFLFINLSIFPKPLKQNADSDPYKKYQFLYWEVIQ
jgi:hypothetical protein